MSGTGFKKISSIIHCNSAIVIVILVFVAGAVVTAVVARIAVFTSSNGCGSSR